MNIIFDSIRDLFFGKNNDTIKVGLSQFKKVSMQTREKTMPRRTKEVKLSDLMRRAS